MIFSAPAVIISVISSLANEKQISNIHTCTNGHLHLSTAAAGLAE
jgi:hypothetical protein